MERTKPDLIKAFAETLKAKRKEAGLSQEELAHRTEISVSYISRLETENRQPSLSVLSVLANEFGISISELIADAEARL